MSKDTSKATPSGSASRREALRKQREAEAKRQRTTRIIIVAAIIIAVVIVSIVTVNLVQSRSKQQGRNEIGSGEQFTPTAANVDRSTISSSENTDATDLPVVINYSDFQCPGCASFGNAIVEPLLRELAADGKITLEYMQLFGQDRGIPGDNSYRANIAWLCATELGYQNEYMDTIYRNQPQQGVGWTDEQLQDTWANQAGISGDNLETFQQCVIDGATSDYVQQMQSALPSVVRATPSYTVNGNLVELSPEDVNSADALYNTLMEYA